MDCRETEWKGRRAVRLRCRSYEALILPDKGANCISLRHLPTGAELFRTPAAPEEIDQAPNVYGLPLLFPPNRIRDGVYTFQGRRYAFPINEPQRHNHIHGALSVSPFLHRGNGVFSFRAGADAPYLAFPHAFTVKREYSLDGGGLFHRVTFRNDSDGAFPLGTGVHAAWRLPFVPGDDPADYSLQVPAAREWALEEERKLPTGTAVGDSPLLDALRQGKMRPDIQPLSSLIQCSPGNVILRGGAGRLIMDMEGYGFLMLWNGGGGQGFLCPEPQSWVNDAPNLPLPWEETGMQVISPGQERSFSLRFRFEAREQG